MTDQELRALVREAIAQQAAVAGRPATAGPSPMPHQRHASHALFMVPTGADADGPCLIEPAVLCNHCGYCRAYGH